MANPRERFNCPTRASRRHSNNYEGLRAKLSRAVWRGNSRAFTNTRSSYSFSFVTVTIRLHIRRAYLLLANGSMLLPSSCSSRSRTRVRASARLCSPLLASESSDTHCTIPSLLSFSVASLRGAPPTSLLVSTLTIAEHLPLFSLPLFPPSFLSRPCGQREFVTLRATDQLVTLSWLFFLLRRRARLSFDERTVDFFAVLSTGHDQFPRKIFKVG